MALVGPVRESTWQKDGQDVVTYWVTLDGKEVPCYDAQAKALDPGKLLPEGWEIRQSKAGKDYLKPPGKGGGKSFSVAHRNTKEGQAYEQERMDRRTALMQAAIVAGANTGVLFWADEFYNWLRKTSGEPSTRPSQVPPPFSSVPAEGQSPDPSKYLGTQTEPSGGEAHRQGASPSASTSTSPETVQESGLNSFTQEVAVTPTPGAVTEIGAEGAKHLALLLGGQKAAFDLARDQWPDTTNLRKLRPEQATELLEIAGKSA